MFSDNNLRYHPHAVAFTDLPTSLFSCPCHRVWDLIYYLRAKAEIPRLSEGFLENTSCGYPSVDAFAISLLLSVYAFLNVSAGKRVPGGTSRQRSLDEIGIAEPLSDTFGEPTRRPAHVLEIFARRAAG